MSPRLTAQQQKLLAVALLCISAIVVLGAVTWPILWANRYYGTSLAEAQDRLARYSRIAATRPMIEQAIVKTEQERPTRFYLRGESASIAAAELQNLITRIISEQNGKVVSSQVIPQRDDPKNPAVSKVTINVQLSAAITPLQLILHAFETNEPSLFIDQLTVRAQFGRGYRLVPGIQPEYAAQMTIHGYAIASGRK